MEEFKAAEKAKTDAMVKFATDKAKEASGGGPQDLIPKKYASPLTSGFAVEIVTDESKNNFTFDLKD